MFNMMIWSRGLTAVLAWAMFAAEASANAAWPRVPTPPTAFAKSVSTQTTPPDSIPTEAAGSPELGVLIILGIVGTIVFLAWLFAHIGDNSGRNGDKIMG